ncbi:MAG: hypothetical protein NW241_15945 [Bacteroidia bacterium]|nr:hypothetical protein [Bacteroidia bacterium]
MSSSRITRFSALFAGLLVLTASACRPDGAGALSETDLVAIVEDAVAGSTGGVELGIEDAADLAEALLDACNEPGDSTLTRSGTLGQLSYSYVLYWEYSLICSGLGIPQTFSVGFGGEGEYQTARMSSEDEISGSFLLTGLNPGADSLVYDGSFSRNGTQTTSGRRGTTYTTQLTLTSSNLTADKGTYEILSGTCSVFLSGSNGSESFTRNGTLTFLGNQQATLEWNGQTYPINW